MNHNQNLQGLNLKDKVAIITGASSGIGRATTCLLACHGCKLVLVDREESRLNETIEKCRDKKDVIRIAANLNDKGIHDQIVKRAIEAFGHIDILVNNAAICERDNIMTIDEEKLHRVMTTNLKSVICLTKACVPRLIESKGVIVNVSSMFGKKPNPECLSYSISKAGLDQFARCIALELAPKQVRVNNVNPGAIDTKTAVMCGLIKCKRGDNKAELNEKDLPMNRVGSPNEVAAVIAFLASEQASYVTGELINVDGAMHLA